MKLPRWIQAILLIFGIGTLCSCWGYAEVYYEYPDHEPPYDHVTPPELDLVGSYRLLGFDVDFYDYDTGIYIGSAYEGDYNYDFSGDMRIGPDTFYQRILFEGSVHFTMSDYWDVVFTNRPYEGIFDLFYNYDGEFDYDDISFSCWKYNLMTVSYTCSSLRGLCWEEWDYWEKVSDWP